MARKRMIDPSIWEDPDFSTLSRDARLLFIGLVTNADDEGYLRGHEGSLKRLVFGFDDDLNTNKVKELRSEISEKMKSVHVYEVEKEIFIHLYRWEAYQKQAKDRVQASVYPKCNTCYPNAKQVFNQVSKKGSK